VIELFYGDPDADLVARAKRGGSIAGWQIGSAAEARAARAAGCDYVVTQGMEAGGHVRGRLPVQELLAETSGLGLPVVAAGGIGSAIQVDRALEAGASAVRVGTRFVAAEESAAHPTYIEALIAATREDTVLTTAFGVGWPDAAHRVLRSALEAAERLSDDVVATIGGGPIPRFSPVPPTREALGEVGAMALYAGHSVDGVAKIQPAAAIVAELMRDRA
jgi:nitronate monooxygenase